MRPMWFQPTGSILSESMTKTSALKARRKLAMEKHRSWRQAPFATNCAPSLTPSLVQLIAGNNNSLFSKDASVSSSSPSTFTSSTPWINPLNPPQLQQQQNPPHLKNRTLRPCHPRHICCTARSSSKPSTCTDKHHTLNPWISKVSAHIPAPQASALAHAQTRSGASALTTSKRDLKCAKGRACLRSCAYAAKVWLGKMVVIPKIFMLDSVGPGCSASSPSIISDLVIPERLPFPSVTSAYTYAIRSYRPPRERRGTFPPSADTFSVTLLFPRVRCPLV